MTAILEATPHYRVIGREVELFEAAAHQRLPLLLQGPTGCGKSRFVESMAVTLNRPLVTVACNDETSAVDLLGRFLIEGGGTVWQDGPVTRAVRQGAILYLDEIAEAREDVIVALHPLTDHRRELHLDRLDQTVKAPDGFQLVASYNPGYRRGLRELRASTRQRFLAIAFDYADPATETEIVTTESGVERRLARRLVEFARKVRALDDLGLEATVSTRLLVAAGRLMHHGIPPRAACEAAIVRPLSDDTDVTAALLDAVALQF